MTLPYPIAASQVDKKSPVDEQLMQAIKANLEELDTRTISANAATDFRLNGRLNPRYNSADPNTAPRRHRVDGALISKDSLFQSCKVTVEDGGVGGTLDVDVRRYTKPNCLITSVVPLFRDAISSIARAGSGISTQSIARATPQISTQSIAKYKTQLNIQSIISLGKQDGTTNLYYYRVNLNSAPDSDYVGLSVKLASTTGALYDGDFTVINVNEDGGSNVIISSTSSIAEQASAAGTLDANLWKYTFTNPVNTHFAAAEVATFASHTNAANDGALEIFAVNQGGNNIIVKNTSGVAQAGVAGTADCNRWTFTYSGAPSTTDYAVGESALMASHSTGGNNGTFPIRAVNSGGNNLIIYNASGAVQGGAAGTANTCRWVYSFSGDPSTDVTAGDNIIFVSATTAANNGTFAVKEVNRSGTNIVVHNTSGVAQGGAVGTAATEKKKVSFASNQADIIVGSRVRIVNSTVITENDYDVFERNRGGGSNFNAVIKTSETSTLAVPQGRVAYESKSLFTTRPSLSLAPKTLNWAGTHGAISTNAVFDEDQAEVPEGTLVMMDVIEAPIGAKNLTVQLY